VTYDSHETSEAGRRALRMQDRHTATDTGPIPTGATSGREETSPVRPRAERVGRSRRAPLGLVLLLGTIIASAALFGLHIKVYQPLSPVDEIQHVDYVFHLLNGDLVVSGDAYTPEGQDVVACRWIDTLPRSVPCGGPYELNTLPAGGLNTAYIHPPFYYLTPAATVLVGKVLGVEGDLVNFMRLSSVLWWGLFVLVGWRLFRELDVNRWARAGGLLLLAASPVVVQTHSIVNNDVTALPAGAAITLAALLWDKGRLRLTWLLLLGAVAVALKSTNIAVLVAVALFALIRLWQAHGPDWRRSPVALRRTVVAVAGLAVVSVVVGFAWSVLQTQIQLVDPTTLPQNRQFVTDRFQVSWLTVNVDAFLTAIEPEFLDTVLVGDTARVVAVLTNYGVLILALFGAARAEAGSRVRALALAIGASALIVPMLLVIMNYVTAGIHVGITSRYGLSLVPGMLAVGLTSVQSRSARVVIVAAGVVAVAAMAYQFIY
jgi:hypothetical protein